MKHLIFLLSFSSIVYSQEISSFRDKKEVFLGLNRDLKFDTVFIGFNTGYTRRIADTKRIYYRLDAQYIKQYHNSTQSHYPEFLNEKNLYENLTTNCFTLYNMFSFRYYQKKTDRLYFELGFHLGINLWQQKKGSFFKLIGNYQYEQEEIKKNYFLTPSNAGIQLGFGIRATKKILLKPELRLGLLSFDKLYNRTNLLAQMLINSPITANFNISYLF
jgi:hypothetical protein